MMSDQLKIEWAGACRELLGSAAGANIFNARSRVAYGGLPMTAVAIETAIDLNVPPRNRRLVFAES